MKNVLFRRLTLFVFLIVLGSCAQPTSEYKDTSSDGAANGYPRPAEVVDFGKDYAEYFQANGRMEHHVFRHFGHAFFNDEINSNRITAKFVASPIRYSFVGDAVDPLRLNTELFIEDVATTINYGFKHVKAETPLEAVKKSDLIIMVVDANEWRNFYAVYNRFLNELLDNRLGIHKIDLDALVPHGVRCTAFSIKRRRALPVDGSLETRTLIDKAVVIIERDSYLKSSQTLQKFCVTSNLMRGLGVEGLTVRSPSVANLVGYSPALSAYDVLALKSLYSRSMPTGASHQEFVDKALEFREKDLSNVGPLVKRKKN